MKKITSKLLDFYSEIEYIFGKKTDRLDVDGLPSSGRKKMVYLKQVHGNKIYELMKKPKGTKTCLGEYDGAVSSIRGVDIWIKTADCIPILIYDNKRKVISAIHSGWRSTLQNITGYALDILEKGGSNLENIIVVMGPSISIREFEVNQDVYSLFLDKFSDLKEGEHYIKREKKYYLDLKKMIFKICVDRGVKKENIEIIDHCTVEMEKDYYSYRREGNMGRMYSKISLLD